MNYNRKEILSKVIKYVTEFVIVALAVTHVRKDSTNSEIFIVAAISAITLAILDIMFPYVKIDMKNI